LRHPPAPTVPVDANVNNLLAFVKYPSDVYVVP
jgi:hypothetical protein